MRFVDIKGKRFGWLTVLERADNVGRYIMWLCECDCGTHIIIRGDSLKNGRTKSCGCFRVASAINNATTHNMWGTPEYRCWRNMIQRCTNPNNKQFQYYGGRGIKICKEWLSGFENFFTDMGLKPFPKLTIERVDNEKGYNKGNCVWATRSAQTINQRIRKDNTSGYKGISWDRRDKKYRSEISKKGKTIYLGGYNRIEEAVKARKQGELKYWGKETK